MDLAVSKYQQVDLMKKYLPLFLLALGLVAFVPQKAKADGYFGISVGPAYCDPYPVYYGGYYPRYYRHYYTTIIRTATDTGATTVIGTTMMMIKPKRFAMAASAAPSLDWSNRERSSRSRRVSA